MTRLATAACLLAAAAGAGADDARLERMRGEIERLRGELESTLSEMRNRRNCPLGAVSSCPRMLKPALAWRMML